MKILKQYGHQGDTQWFNIDKIPEGAKKLEKKQFIAESERAGSMHALFGNYDMYEVDDGFVIDAKEECVLNHSLQTELLREGVSMSKPAVLPEKDHRSSTIPEGLFFVGIQQRFDPLENLKKKVED